LGHALRFQPILAARAIIFAMQISLDTVRDIARLLEENDLAEIALESAPSEESDQQPFRLTLQRAAKTPPIRRASASAPRSQPASSAPAPAATSSTETITSNVVGLFRTATPAIEVGAEVRAGQVVGIVEALRVPNEIKTVVAGRISEVLAEAGQIVEYGQELFKLEPAPTK
jgi:acetyl-CoA carboxylase biotin carboxyl carrier protein